MTSNRRPAILLITALLAVGCAANPAPSSMAPSQAIATASPVATAEPNPSASPAPAQTPIPTASPEPTTTACPARARGDDPMVTFEALDTLDAFWMQLAIQEMAPVTAPDQPLEPPPFPSHWDWVEFLPGGRETRLVLDSSPAGWPATPITISKLRLTLHADGQDPIKLPVRIEIHENATPAFVDVPNITWSGTLEIVAEWQDPCFVYRARSTAPLIIDPAATLEGCAQRRQRAFDELAAVFEPPIGVGPVDANLAPWLFSGKVTSLAVIDPLPPYTGFNRETPTLTAEPGETVTVTSWSDELDLWLRDDAEVEFFRRGELIRWMEGGWIHGDEPEAKVIFRAQLVESPEGFTLTLPSEPGRFAATALFTYNSACSFGAAGFVVGVDVE